MHLEIPWFIIGLVYAFTMGVETYASRAIDSFENAIIKMPRMFAFLDYCRNDLRFVSERFLVILSILMFIQWLGNSFN